MPRLVVLRREILAVEVDEFGAEEADAAGVILLHSAHVAHAADVAKTLMVLPSRVVLGLPFSSCSRACFFWSSCWRFFRLLSRSGVGST